MELEDFQNGNCSIFELLPNETILRVFKYLDAQSLVIVLRVCHQFRDLCNQLEPLLWKKLCRNTGRILGDFTKAAASYYASAYGWKRCYYWINSEDLQTFEDPQLLFDYAMKMDEDLFKRRYLLSRGIELFPNRGVVYQYYADLLSDQPDENSSWKSAGQLYRQAIVVSEMDPKPNQKSMPFILYRYSQFLSTNQRDYEEADKQFRRLLKLIPGNSWILERYAEFMIECRHRYNLAERIFRLILNSVVSGSAMSNYGLFLWHIRRNYQLAMKCFQIASEIDMERVYFWCNFIGRRIKDEPLARQILMQSKLFQHVEAHPEDEQALFSLALAFHQIHCVDEAEQLYRKHMRLTKKTNVYTVSNLAELLGHSRFSFAEAEELYRIGLKSNGGCHETIEMALAGLLLAQGKIDEGLKYLDNLLSSSYIQCVKTTFTEGNILLYIHSPNPQQRRQALEVIKRQLITERVRPKLILMFDANLKWAREQKLPDYEWIEKIAQVYNCEIEIESLDEWEEWQKIEVPQPPPDEEVTMAELRQLLSEPDNGQDDEEDQDINQPEELQDLIDDQQQDEEEIDQEEDGLMEE